MKDILLILLGVALGIVVKVLLDPILERRKRKAERREKWLEGCLEHAKRVLTLIKEVRRAAVAKLGLIHSGAHARAVVRALTPTDGPDPLDVAVEHDRELAEVVQASKAAWMALQIARMDDEHGAEPAQEEHDPLFAVQRYQTALTNFAAAARKKLAN